MMGTQRKMEWAPPSSATGRQSKTFENPLPPPPSGAKQVDSPCRLRKRVQHSLFFSIAATTLGTAFYIMLLLGFAWLVRASFSLNDALGSFIILSPVLGISIKFSQLAGQGGSRRNERTDQERSGRTSSRHCLHRPLSLSGPDSISRVGNFIRAPITRDNRWTASCSCSLRFGI